MTILIRDVDFEMNATQFQFTETGAAKISGDIGGAASLPVGVILLTEENTNPADLGIAGTWEAY